MWRGLVFGLSVNLLFGGLAIATARRWLPEWWDRKPLRFALKLLPALGATGVLLWFLARAAGSHTAVWGFSMLAGWTSLLTLGIALSLPISAAILRLTRKPSEARAALDPIPQNAPSPQNAPTPQTPTRDTTPKPPITLATKPITTLTDEPIATLTAEPIIELAAEPAIITPSVGLTRRQVLHGVASAVPALAIGTVTGGVAMGSKLAEIKPMTFSWAGLAPQFEGFKILHLSDIHIGAYVGLGQLQDLIEDAIPHKPDLVLVTGDLSDDLDRLPEALRMIHAIGAPHGAWSSIGNHEYYRGLGRVKRIHTRSDVPLLMETSTTLDVGGARLCLAGADDPVNLRRDSDEFLRNTVQTSLRDRPDDAFTIMMSHRPRGFVEAANQGVDLTLSGHTHGGQFGVFGRSLFERGENFFWGHYKKGESQLYTSSGVGHWLPVRIGCPTEAPLITLSAAPGGHRGPNSSS